MEVFISNQSISGIWFAFSVYPVWQTSICYFLIKKKEEVERNEDRPREFGGTRKNTKWLQRKENKQRKKKKWEWGTDFAVQKFHRNSNSCEETKEEKK